MVFSTTLSAISIFCQEKGGLKRENYNLSDTIRRASSTMYKGKLISLYLTIAVLSFIKFNAEDLLWSLNDIGPNKSRYSIRPTGIE
jgi:hypothetical protein